MEIISMQPVFRKNDNELKNKSNFFDESLVLDRIEDLSKKIVISASVKRKPLEKTSNVSSEDTKGHEFFKNLEFSKLRAPSTLFQFKRTQGEEKLMNGNCEILFECVKPVRHISVTKKFQNLQPSLITRSILKTNDFTFDKKAKRKVQFLSFCEKNDITSLVLSTEKFQPSRMLIPEIQVKASNAQELENMEVAEDLGLISKKQRSTTSSYDFINTVFPVPLRM